MHTADYDYALPEAQIARHPAPRRDASRLLVVERAGGLRRHLGFSDLPDVLSGDELLVVNDTRVLHARVLGRRLPGGGRVELLLVRPAGDGWLALGRASRPLRAGARLQLPGDVEAEVRGRAGDGLLRLTLAGTRDVPAWLAAHGAVPLPPYLRREAEAADAERYQTVYAARDGAVAAPTAGLHFTPELLDALRSRGSRIVSLTLHVGPGTFTPVRTDDPRQHRLEPEHYEIPEETASALAAARQEGRPVLAVGTTVVRTLEHAASRPAGGPVPAGPGLADLLILPGHRFSVVDRLLTNFHLPRSSLLMLVCALAGRETTLSAYAEAVARGYRFYSYGDATLWL